MEESSQAGLDSFPAHRRRFGAPVLVAALLAEVLIFSGISENFLTAGNFIEIARFSVELGLLAVALTPILIAGGIDLSVGSTMGMAAVLFGMAWKDWNLPLPLAVGTALLAGAAGGGLNAVLIARLRLPPLIVTLGTLSLVRGIAEGLTHAAVNYSGFPDSFLFLGQGYIGSIVPAQALVFLLVFAGYVVLLHRSIFGRALYAIGFTAAGARYAGIPVAKRTALVYVMSGLVSGLAAVIYAAHLGQVRSDAGAGYELHAITAVVLGGTSVFGGRGSLWGTLWGLLSLTVLQNGMHLAALPSELTGICTGALLVSVIGIDRIRRQGARDAGSGAAVSAEQGQAEFSMKNSQMAMLCATIVAAALIVAGTNVWMMRSIAGPNGAPASGPAAGGAPRRLVIAMMPKAKGDPYFVSVRGGAEEAARELGAELIWDGPTSLEAAKQNEIVESWITRKVDVIAVSVENRAGISTVLRKAKANGIRVLTWDADAEPDARDFFVNQATAEGIGFGLTDEAARLLDGKGQFAIVTGALSAANQNEWISHIRKRMAAKHPGLELATIRPSDDDRDKAFAEAQTLLKVYPKLDLIMAISAPAVPGAAEAVRQAGRKDVRVMGLSLPNINKEFVHKGVVQTVMLWSTRDLGYLTVYAGALLAEKRLGAGASSIKAGRLGEIEVRGDQIILGPPLMMHKDNIDNYDF
jgi:rhamnose transport system permease protein